MSKYFIAALLLIFSLSSIAQSNLAKIDSLNSSDPKINFNIDLKEIIDSAMVHSPLLMVPDTEIEKLLEEIKIRKKSWLEYIQIDANTRYGLYNQLTVSNQTNTTDISQSLQSNKTQLNYFAGLTLKIPLSYFVSNKREVNILKSGIKGNELKKEQLKKEVTLLVVDEYYKLKKYQETIPVLQNVYQTMKISYLKASKELESGTYDIGDFAILVTTLGKAEQSFLEAKNEYFAQYYKLQILTGSNLENISK